MPNALRDLHTSDPKDLAINLAMLAYGNRPNAMKFARANNSDLLRALKHLMETTKECAVYGLNLYSVSYLERLNCSTMCYLHFTTAVKDSVNWTENYISLYLDTHILYLIMHL